MEKLEASSSLPEIERRSVEYTDKNCYLKRNLRILKSFKKHLTYQLSNDIVIKVIE